MPAPHGTGPERFLLPCYTVPAEDAVIRAGFHPDPQAPLPSMLDPEYPPVTSPSSEPLVPLQHRRIRLLSNYWHAGWDNALPATWLRADALDRLAFAADRLPERLGLAVFDAWRPLALQAELYDAAYHEPGLPPGFVAEPIADPATPPPHLTGGTVDLTLTLDGTPLALGTGFDDFTAAALTESLETVPGAARELRRLLYRSLRSVGFVVLHCEWWHFEFGTRRWAALTGNNPIYGPAHPPT